MSVNKRDVKMIEPKKTLINTMANLLKKQNLEDISVSVICDEARINRAVFYAYFTNKYDLINYF